MPKKLTIDQLHNKFQQQNLILYPEDQIYNGIDKKLQFKCCNHHIFSTYPRYIIQKKSGCPTCSSLLVGSKNTKSHSYFLQKLEERNQKCETKIFLKDGQQYIKTYTKLWFMCDKNHEFETLPKTVIRGSGCPKCKIINNVNRQTYTLQEFKQILENRNTIHPLKKVFLRSDKDYINTVTRTWFTCEKNHEWYAVPNEGPLGGSGCPICASSKNFSFMAMDWLDSVAKLNNIKILHKLNNGMEFSIPNTKYKVDGYCVETNTVYEFYGDYWHGNPLLFDENDINESVGKTYGQLYQETKNREQIIQNLGYNLVTIWGNEYTSQSQHISLINKFEKIKKKICNNVTAILIPINSPCIDKYKYTNQLNIAIKNNQRVIFVFMDEWIQNIELVTKKLLHYANLNILEKIHGRKCSIKLVSSKEKQQFLDSNHIQGNDNSQIAYGAYYQDKLVALMSFSIPRIAVGHKKQYDNVWELCRFTTDINYRIPGIASKLLCHFQRNHKWKEIYSYADRRWSIGNLYEKLGFTLTRTNPPDYFYVVNGIRKHRWNYRKDVLKNTLPNYDQNKTEQENMINAGYHRVWGCGTLKYTMLNPTPQ